MKAQRFITYQEVVHELNSLPECYRLSHIGNSTEHRAVYSASIGNGSFTVMAWSQMHGDEPTSTRVLLELMKRITEYPELLSKYTFFFIPMVNPDGAEQCTRSNKSGIDLNRDFNSEKAVETRILKKMIYQINPDLAFNMHDQRSIFSAVGMVSTLSFLAPSPDAEKSNPPHRILSAGFASKLVRAIGTPPDGWGVARFDDTFYPNAFGDNLMREGFANVLLEFGHTPGDYNRSWLPEYFCDAWLRALYEFEPKLPNAEKYLQLPIQQQAFVDLKVNFIEGCSIMEPAYFQFVGKRSGDQFIWAFRPFYPDYTPKPYFEQKVNSPLVYNSSNGEDLEVLKLADDSELRPEDFI